MLSDTRTDTGAELNEAADLSLDGQRNSDFDQPRPSTTKTHPWPKFIYNDGTSRPEADSEKYKSQITAIGLIG